MIYVNYDTIATREKRKHREYFVRNSEGKRPRENFCRRGVYCIETFSKEMGG